MPFEKAKWIWSNQHAETDEYAEFVDSFYYEGGRAKLYISADSNYAVYLNGKLSAWGQYADFPYDKIYDEIDITEYCKKGSNRMAILVWYYGIDTTQCYYPGNASLIYEVSCAENVLCLSDEKTLSRKSHAYISHKNKLITGQLGLSYEYDATKEDSWIIEDVDDFSESVIVKQAPSMRVRPCQRLIMEAEVCGKKCKEIERNDLIFDLGGEQVGFLSFEIESDCEQEIVVAYGEHLALGCVHQKVEGRDFSISYRATKGKNVFLNPFRRFGCRYLEIHSKTPLKIHKMAIAPTMYPVKQKDKPVLNNKHNKIYDMCVETLKLCMHEHYEDCPWREQGLYTMDSRNQMLCGYYAFGEYEFVRANLELISKDNRKDALLSICYPMKGDLVIPSFSLHYITACREYLEHSGDSAFLEEIYPKLTSITNAFTSRIKNGLIPMFQGSSYWNFYEWKEGLNGYGETSFEPDIILNTLLSLTLQNMAIIADALNKEHTYVIQAKELNQCIIETFWDKERKVFCNRPDLQQYSELGNYLSILCGAIEGTEAKALCERIREDENITPISLSMKCFKYDAWLKVDANAYAPAIFEDIERVYTPMIESGGTTVWETELGEADFGGAGSLCHGWSALPVYYYHILNQAKNE